MTSGTVTELNSKTEYDKLLSDAGDTLVVIDFYAVWCGPCKVIAPKVAQLAQEMTDVLFAKVDVDNVSEVAENCGISAMPTFQFYKAGKKVAEFKGADFEKLKATVNKNK